jgi:hypothetical protein
VPGTVFGQQRGDDETILTFQPSAALDPDAVYFAVVRGVANLSANTSGVLNYWGVGMNVTSTSAVVSPVPNTSAFNGVVFKNSYVWSFMTKPASGEDNGICAIDHVGIFPGSYLFHTAVNDLNENDINPQSRSFDTAADRDKVFYASALSNDGQILHPVVGYAWNWIWGITKTNPVTAKIINNDDIGSDSVEPFSAASSSQLIQAQEGIVNSHVQASAEVNLVDTAISAAGKDASSTADVYVFICTSTWPAINPDGTWYPWRDQTEGANCLAGSGSCQNMNYDLYYCRDNGSNGNLPSVNMPATTRGSNLGCTDANGSCADKAVGDSCGSGGTCQDLLKEPFFFSQ